MQAYLHVYVHLYDWVQFRVVGNSLMGESRNQQILSLTNQGENPSYIMPDCVILS